MKIDNYIFFLQYLFFKVYTNMYLVFELFVVVVCYSNSKL